MDSSSSKPFTFNKTFTLLPLCKEDIDEFVGPNGSLIHKNVVRRACDTLFKKTFCDDPDPRVTIKVITLSNGLDVVVAECSAASQELLDEVMSSLSEHQKNFLEARRTP